MRVLVVVLVSLVVTSVSEAQPRPKHQSKQERKMAARDDDRKPKRNGQSIGAPWAGSLRNASRLRLGDGAHIRRPHRAYGTRTTIQYTRDAINDTLEMFKDTHDLAIGDISAEHGATSATTTRTSRAATSTSGCSTRSGRPAIPTTWSTPTSATSTARGPGR